MAIVNRALLLSNIAVFVLQGALGAAFPAMLALWPLGRFYVGPTQEVVGFAPWQLVTSAFIHASVTHLFLNMFALYMFGREIERTLGSIRYALMYFGAVITAALVQLAVVSSSSAGPYPTVGASGGVFGVLLAFGVLFPRQTVTLLFPPIPMPAWLFVTLYGALELANGIYGTREGVAHFAHLGGMLGAALVLLPWWIRARRRLAR